MKLIIYFALLTSFFYSTKPQLFEALNKLPPPAIFQSGFDSFNNSQFIFRGPFSSNNNSFPRFLESGTNIAPNPNAIPSQITPMMFDHTLPGMDPTHLLTEIINENHGGTPLPDFIKEDIAPKLFKQQHNSENDELFFDGLKSAGVSIKNQTIYLEPETKIHVANSTITMKQLENLINFNMNLMRKCGKNLEFCMIKDNGFDEEELLGVTMSENIVEKPRMKFLQVNGDDDNAQSIQNELDDILLENNNNDFEYHDATNEDDLDLESFNLEEN